MKLMTIGVAAAVTLALSAGTALAQAGTMQPIPNPPEKPAAAKHHGKMHHHKKHHAKKHHAAKKAADETKSSGATTGATAPK